MAFQWAGAGAGASDALQDLLAKRMLEQYQQAQLAQRQQEQSDQVAQQQAQHALQQKQEARLAQGDQADQTYRTGQVARQAKQDDIVDADRRQVQNQRGVRSMILEGMRSKATDPLTAHLMAAGEGVDIGMDVLDPERGMREAEQKARFGADQQIRVERERGAQDRLTDGAKVKAQAPSAPSPYMAERNARNKQSVNELLDKVSNWTAGAGSVLARVPGTDARNFQAELDTLKANVAFGELTAMREASKTGGALGQVAVRELELLTSTLGSLDAGQSPANLKKQLGKVRDSIARWEMAQGGMAAPDRSGGDRGGDTASVQRWGRDANGRPVRLQ